MLAVSAAAGEVFVVVCTLVPAVPASLWPMVGPADF